MPVFVAAASEPRYSLVMKEQAHCPRCGYDLRGETARWAFQCPVRGVCSECGYDFDWFTLLSPRFAPPPGFFEADPRFATLLRTLRKSLRPREFWSWVHMGYPVHVVRATIAGVVAMLSCYLVLATIAATLWILAPLFTIWLAPAQPAVVSQMLSADAPPISVRVVSMYGPAVTSTWKSTIQSVSIRWAGFSALQRMMVAATILLPFSFSLLPTTMRRARVRPRHLARIFAYGLLWLPFGIMLPRVILAMLQSFTMVLGLCGFSFAGSSNTEQTLTSVLRLASRHTDSACMLVIFFATGLWWARACEGYLKIAHSRAVGFMLFGLCTLLVMAAVAMLDPSRLRDLARILSP